MIVGCLKFVRSAENLSCVVHYVVVNALFCHLEARRGLTGDKARA